MQDQSQDKRKKCSIAMFQTLPPSLGPPAEPGFLEVLEGFPGFLGAGTLKAEAAEDGLFPSTDSSSSKLLSVNNIIWKLC